MAEFGEPLSGRELEVLHCVASGAANKEIAAELSISQNTVKVHLRNVFTKLGVASRTEATTVALQQGLLTIPGTETAVPEPIDPLPDLPPEPEPEADAAVLEAPLPPRSLPWPIIGLGVVTVAAVLLAAIFGLRAVNSQPDPEPTPEPFTDSRIDDTQWFTSREMPEGRAGMAVTAVGLNVYLIGGETNAGVAADVARFNSSDKSWLAAAAKPTAVTDVSAAVLGGEIFVPGGRLADGSVTAVVEAYSPANDAWRPVASLPQPVAGGLALSDGSFLYLFGGWDGTDYLDTAFVYDPASDGWRPLPPLAQPRAFAAGGAITNQLYVVGGFLGAAELADCAYFDTAVESWTDCPPLLAARGGGSAAVVLNKLYVFGGGLTADNDIDFAEIFDPNTQTWQVINTPTWAGTAVTAWPHLGAANVETRIYLVGGELNAEFLSDNLVYTPIVYQTFIPAASAGPEN